MDLGLAGKVAVVTGGSQGIGRAAAEALGREGARVVICARQADRLEQVAQELSGVNDATIIPITDEDWQADLDLKLFAAIRSIRLVVPHLRAAGGGSIINLLNIGAKQPGAA